MKEKFEEEAEDNQDKNLTHSCTLFPSWSEVQPVKMNCSQVPLFETAASWYREETEDKNISLECRVLLVYGSCSCGGVCQRHREQVQPHNMSNIEKSDSPLAFQVQLQRQRRPPISLTFWAPSEASGLWFRVGMERWTGHRGTVLRVQKVQTFSMCCSAGGVSQELLLDVAAESTPEPTKPEGVSVRSVMRAKTCTLTGDTHGVSKSSGIAVQANLLL